MTTIILSSASQVSASFTSGTWIGATSNDLLAPTNWSSNPVIPNDIATFDSTATTKTPELTGVKFINEFRFPSTFPFAYVFQIKDSLTFTGAGIVNTSSLQQEFDVNTHGVTRFFNSASADSTASGKVTFKLATGALILFSDTSHSSNANFIFLDTSIQVAFSQTADDIYSGVISGTGGSAAVNIGTGLKRITFTGANTYSGTTTITTSTLQAGAVNTFSANSDVNINNAAGVLDLNNFNNTISTLTGIAGAKVTLGSGTLSLAGGGNTAYAGSITGTGGLTKLGTSAGIFRLDGSGINTYSGTTTLLAGTLQAGAVDAFSPFSNVTMADSAVLELNDKDNTIGALSGVSGNTVRVGTARLTFGNNSNGTYGGTITGAPASTLIALGTGTFTLNGDCSSFFGTTHIENKLFALNNNLGGNVFVESGGTIGGNGRVLGDLTINSGGTIAPGNSIETLHVTGSYVQNANTTYHDEVNPAGQTDLIAVTGTATLLGGQVVVDPIGGYNFDTSYVILSALGGRTGTFAGVTAPGLVTASLEYPPNQVILKIDPNLASAACSSTTQEIANQLDSLQNLTPEQTAILNALVSLSPEEACRALYRISGQQHAAAPLVTEIVNRQFIRRLYDPLRPIVTTTPCCDVCCDPCKADMDAWLEASGGYFSTTGKLNTASGIKMNGYEITGGLQKTFCHEWTVGIAGSYEHDKLDFKHGGSENFNSYFGGLYGLYRPANYYVLADVSYGQTTSKLARHLHFGDFNLHAHSKPKISQFTFYAEAGLDLCMCSFLIQPFVGIEVDTIWRKRLQEHGAHDLNLTVFKKDHTNAFSRLGLHMTTTECDFSLSIDLAWLYRLNGEKNRLHQEFACFGTPFFLEGINFNRNSFEGAITLSKVICDDWRVYLQASGEVWNHAGGGYGLAGIEYSW